MRLDIRTKLYVGTASWVEILPVAYDRKYFSVYSRTGDSYVVLNDPIDSHSILVPEGETLDFHPNTPVNRIYYKGLGSHLLAHFVNSGYGLIGLRFQDHLVVSPNGIDLLTAYVVQDNLPDPVFS
jgi:hypothetical protein